MTTDDRERYCDLIKARLEQLRNQTAVLQAQLDALTKDLERPAVTFSPNAKPGREDIARANAYLARLGVPERLL